MNFARTLNFTSSNEDGASELAALALTPQDRVLCLTASGGRPLDLLLGDPGAIVAIDVNPAQNALLALKTAAIRTLAPDDLYAYLGINPCDDRLKLHGRVETALDEGGRAFWRDRGSIIRRGVWLSGRWERVLRLGALGNGFARGRAITELFAADTPAAQADIWRLKFDDWLWRGSIRLLSQRWIWTRVVGEPGGAHLPSSEACVQRLGGAFRRAAGSFLFRDSDFAWLIFRGHHKTGGALPLHLQRQNLDIVRERLDRVTIGIADLASLDPATLGQFDAFSLSDFGSYCGQDAYDACWRGVLRVASPGARFCERIFMNPISPSDLIASRLTVDAGLSARLAVADKAIIYEFRCGAIR